MTEFSCSDSLLYQLCSYHNRGLRGGGGGGGGGGGVYMNVQWMGAVPGTCKAS